MSKAMQHMLAVFAALAASACTDTERPDVDMDTEVGDGELAILSTDEQAGTRGELRLGDAGIAFQTTRSVDDSGAPALEAVFTDLAGRELGPGETTDADRAALTAVEHAARAYVAAGALAEDLDVVATAAGFLAAETAPPPGSKLTTVRSCSPDGGLHTARSYFVYALFSNGVYATQGYWMRYNRSGGFVIGPNSNEKLLGSEWSWGSPDAAPVARWFFRNLQRFGVGTVILEAIFDKTNATDPRCSVVHSLR